MQILIVILQLKNFLNVLANHSVLVPAFNREKRLQRINKNANLLKAKNALILSLQK
jgi:hypothetical protein